MPYVENPILFETRLEQVACEVIEEDAPIADTVPSRDYFGSRITKKDECMIDPETGDYVLAENAFEYCVQVRGFEWCVKK